MAIFKSDSIKTPKYMVSFSEGLPGLRMKGTGIEADTDIQ